MGHVEARSPAIYQLETLSEVLTSMMKLLIDLFPVIIFFVVYKSADDTHVGMINATIAAIVAGVAQVAFLWIKERRVERMHLITLALLVGLGGLTIALDDERFIKWKPTAVNYAFAIAFLVSEFASRRNLVRRMLDHAVDAPDHAWTRLNWAWILFFTAVGTLNIYVAFNFSTDTWVNFKLFGVLGLTIVFVVAQGVYLMRFQDEASLTQPEED